VRDTSIRLAFVVSHPVQYYVPLYQRLAARRDVTIKVFYTWHDGSRSTEDPGFRQAFKWDLPLTGGYEHELVPNTAVHSGPGSFLGLQNPELVRRVVSWRPDAVHITGWAWLSHLIAIRRLQRRGIPVLFRGDSHLLDGISGIRWMLKRRVISRVYSWPAAFLSVGKANRAYYRALGVPDDKIWDCPHSIDVERFRAKGERLEQEALDWRHNLGIEAGTTVALFAGKFERKKRPLEFMRAVLAQDQSVVGVMVGSGELESEVQSIARSHHERFRILPFQNQSRMPVVYRLCDVFVLPSGYGETWGLAVNEAMACGRAVLVSNRVGCATDLVDQSAGAIFDACDPASLATALEALCADRGQLKRMGQAAQARSDSFGIPATERPLLECLVATCNR
jgi:glycosyltransferase involved in cell wall biosynthesis